MADSADTKPDTEPDAPAPDTDEASPPPPTPPASPPVRGPLAWASIGVAGVLAVLVVVLAILGYRSYVAGQVDEARSQGLAAARLAAGDVLSYDYRQLDKDFAKAERRLSQPFASEYAETTKTVVRPKALESEAVVTADVVAGSVVSAAEDRVITLLFVNQTTKSNLAAEGRTDLNRVRMTMERVDDKWLVAKLDAL